MFLEKSDGKIFIIIFFQSFWNFKQKGKVCLSAVSHSDKTLREFVLGEKPSNQWL